MLSQKHRLSRSAEVKKTTARGRSFFNPYFVLKFAAGELDTAKITVIVSVKVSKKAVERNRIKRALREEIRKYITEFKPGNYAVIVKKSAVNVPGAELRQSMAKSLITAKILTK